VHARTLLLAAISSALLSACGGDSGAGAEPYDVRTLGSYQDYLVTLAAGGSYTYRNQVVATTAGGFTRRHTSSTSTDYQFNMLSVSGGSEYVERAENHTADGTLTSWTEYSPGFLILSSDTAVGSSDTTVSAVTGTAGDSTYTREVVVDGVESVTVPAGVFNALRTTAHITSSAGGDTYLRYWWVRGIGRVKMAAWAASTPGSVNTWELTAHGVEAVP